MVMSFASEKARKHLLKTGSVFSFRTKKRRHLGYDWINSKRGGPKIADVNIGEEAGYTYSNITFSTEQLATFLEPYVGSSGFGSVEEWLREIERLNGRLPLEGWLYLVTLVKVKEGNRK